MKKKWYKTLYCRISEKAKYSKSMLLKICDMISTEHVRFFPVVEKNNGVYEGHIFYESSKQYTEYTGLTFWGGHFYVSGRKKHDDALSVAWISLLEDCIGIGELGSNFSLYEYVKDIPSVIWSSAVQSLSDEIKFKLSATSVILCK